jgi:hypothetical protein
MSEVNPDFANGETRGGMSEVNPDVANGGMSEVNPDDANGGMSEVNPDDAMMSDDDVSVVLGFGVNGVEFEGFLGFVFEGDYGDEIYVGGDLQIVVLLSLS